MARVDGGGSRRFSRLIVRNGLVLGAALLAAAVVGETCFRLSVPFMTSNVPEVVVPGVGVLKEPNTEIRYTNRFDFWTTDRTNRLGFLDRDPPDPDSAAASCHVAIFGDSFVDAKEVHTDEKLQVRLPELAAERLPNLNLTATAYGRGGSGQIEQLAWYDAYARRLRPNLVVLVYVPNDLMDSSPVLHALNTGWDPDRYPGYTGARRDDDGTIELRPPHPEPAKLLPDTGAGRQPWLARALDGPSRISYLAAWLDEVMERVNNHADSRMLAARVDALIERPAYRASLDGWRPTSMANFHTFPAWDTLPSVFKESMEYAAFGMAQFKERADRDGAAVVVLASHAMTTLVGRGAFDLMATIAAAVQVPVIDQVDYISSLGHKPADGHWARDGHWNAAGHRWAAEAVLEYVEDNPEVCNDHQETSS